MGAAVRLSRRPGHGRRDHRADVRRKRTRNPRGLRSAWGRSPGYEVNREPMLDVIRMHREAMRGNQAGACADRIVHGRAGIVGYRAGARRKVRLQELAGDRAGSYRHHWVRVIATPRASSRTWRCEVQEAGGRGLIKIVNNTVPQALMKLAQRGADQRIVSYIDKNERSRRSAPESEDMPVSIAAGAAGRRALEHLDWAREDDVFDQSIPPAHFEVIRTSHEESAVRRHHLHVPSPGDRRPPPCGASEQSNTACLPLSGALRLRSSVLVDVGNDFAGLLRRVAKLISACGTVFVHDLINPPPTSFLYFTSARSGSMPVVRNPS